MNIHIFSSEHFYTYRFLKFLEGNFDLAFHKFVFKRPTDQKFDYGESLKARIIYPRNNIRFFISMLPELRKSSKILFHQLPHGPVLFLWSLFPGLLSKVTWIIWGGDLYFYTQAKDSFINSIYEILRKRIIRKIPRIASLIPGDFDLALKIYKTKASFIQVTYPPPLDFFNYSASENDSLPRDEVKILIGNSGNSSNNHLEILSKLKSLKDSKIRVFCPLSYGGDQAYINQVVRTGQELLGHKFVPLQSIIEPSKYLDLLWKIDIAIMNHKRQQGLGNTLPLLYFGKKVYLQSDTTTFAYLQGIGCRLFDILSVDVFDESLLSVDFNELTVNQKIIMDLTSEENCIRMWKQILNQ